MTSLQVPNSVAVESPTSGSAAADSIVVDSTVADSTALQDSIRQKVCKVPKFFRPVHNFLTQKSSLTPPPEAYKPLDDISWVGAPIFLAGILLKGEKEAYAHDLDNRYKRGEFTNADSIHFADSLKFETLKKHRIVYGGGGIMPDYFVPLDTTRYTAFHKQLAAKQIIVDANLKYMDKYRAQLKKHYKTFDDFNAKYEVPDTYINSIFEEGKKKKIEPKDEQEKVKTLEYLRPQLKALIARDLWDLTEYFHIWNENSDIINKALEVLGTNSAK